MVLASIPAALENAWGSSFATAARRAVAVLSLVAGSHTMS